MDCSRHIATSLWACRGASSGGSGGSGSCSYSATQQDTATNGTNQRVNPPPTPFDCSRDGKSENISRRRLVSYQDTSSREVHGNVPGMLLPSVVAAASWYGAIGVGCHAIVQQISVGVVMLPLSLNVIGIEDGIFLGGCTGFSGTIKHEPSDFIVNEIDISGRLVEVSSFDAPPPPLPLPPSSASTLTPPPVSTPPEISATLPRSSGTGNPPTTAMNTATTATASSANANDNNNNNNAAAAATTTTSASVTAMDTDQHTQSNDHPQRIGGDAAASSQALRGVAFDGVFVGGEREETGGEFSWSDQLRRSVDQSVMDRLGRLDAAGRACCWPVMEVSPPPTTATAAATAADADVADVAAAAATATTADATATAAAIAAGVAAIATATTGAAADSGSAATDADAADASTATPAAAAAAIAAEPVRIFAGRGADKEARSRVHRAVQETFPFIKTSTEKDSDGGVTVVCTQATTVPVLGGLVTESELEALQRMVNRGPSGEGADKGVTLSSDKDKTNRTFVHRAIAEAFPYLQTKTCSDVKDASVQRISVFWSKRGGKRKRGRPDGGDAGRGRDAASRFPPGRASGGGGRAWVRFALRKEGREHHRVATSLSKALRVPLSFLSFGGVKDKMAITTQVCAVRGVPPAKILKSNGSIGGVTVGNLEYCSHGLSLGELSGNRFTVVVRDANVPATRIEASLRETCSSGFINFFGTQRVGSPSAFARGQPLPYQIGRDLLSGDWEAAVRKVLQPRGSDPPFLHSALSELLQGKISPKKCTARVKGNNRLSVERLVLHGLVRYGPSAFQAAIQCVPYGMRTMWVHAYQSHVWNSVASARIRLFGPQAVPGDLVLPAPGDIAERYPGDSAEASPRDVAGPSPEDVAEPSPVDVSAPPPGGVAEPSPGDVSNPSPSPKASVVGGATSENRKAKVLETVGKGNTRRLPDVNGREGQRVTVLTQAAIDEAAAGGDTPRELLRRVVLPLPGTSISYPSHEVGNMYKRRLDEDKVDALMWKDSDAETTPKDVAGAGTIPAQPAAACLEGASPMVSAPPRNNRGGAGASTPGIQDCRPGAGVGVAAVAAGASSSALVPRGAYRRLLCVPVDAQWSRVAPPSATCDRADHAGEASSDKDSPPAGSSAGGAAGKEAETEPGHVEDVCVSFTLPPGSFATMCLRELMKRNDDVSWGGDTKKGSPDQDVLGTDG
eukprot:jgi/Undpi1/12531/HiC_scaffold_6.g02200.m1